MREQIVPLSSMPAQKTTFIGRQTEIATLSGMLATPACRLVTIVGPGGIGKTRLALAVAAQCGDAFADGIAVASLQSVPTVDLLATAIAIAIGCPLSGGDVIPVQLLNYARHKHVLLVLDNFEHLTDGAVLLAELVAAAPDLQLLVTSREALNVQEEWRFPLTGLAIPADRQMDNLEGSEAVQLFMERARRVRPDLTLDAESAGVARICQLVDGSPLALELAAAWAKTLPTAAIADEIARNLAMLTSSLRNVPDRHRSMRATFDHSWAFLSDAERAVFMRLGVFCDGFQREAAEAVAGATLPLLAALVDKSLLGYDQGGRYRLHELLRQYAEERLKATPDAWEHARDQHCTYYLLVLASRFDGFIGDEIPGGMRDIAVELENIRFAWEHALDCGHFEAIRIAILQMQSFYLVRGPYAEAIAIMEHTIRLLRGALPEPRAALTLAYTLNLIGWQYLRVGRFAEAAAAWTESRDWYTRIDAPLPPDRTSDPVLGLAMAALIDGRYHDAAVLGEEARRRAAGTGHMKDLPYAWYMMTQAALAQGQDDAARHAAHQAAAAATAAGDRWFLAYCQIDLGVVAERAGDYAQARGHFHDSYALREEFADPQGMAIALAHLGRAALRHGEPAEARAQYERSRMLYADLGDRGGFATALHGLGRTALSEGNVADASQCMTQALDLAREMRFGPLILTILAGAGELLARTSRVQEAVEALALVRHHPSAEREAVEHAQRLLADLEPLLTPDVFTAAIARGMAEEPEAVAAQLHAALTTVPGQIDQPVRTALGSARPRSPREPTESVADPLTTREMTVLRLIAAGFSNQQIADELFLAVSTIKWYTGNLFGKLHVRNRTEAVARQRSPFTPLNTALWPRLSLGGTSVHGKDPPCIPDFRRC